MKPVGRCLFFLLAVFCVQATQAQPKCKIEFITTEKGLSHQAVTGMLKDREGFMWFCSWDGLNRFDGQKFVTYKSAPGDESQLGNDRLDMVLEDSSGNLWIEAYDRNIYRFQKATNQFYPIAPILQKQFGRTIGFTRLLAVFDGLVWLQSDRDGIFAVPENIDADGEVFQYASEQAPAFRLTSNTVLFFKRTNDGKVWLGTNTGITCLERNKSGIYTVSQRVSAKLPFGTGFTSFDEDDQNTYFGTTDGRLIILRKISLAVKSQQVKLIHTESRVSIAIMIYLNINNLS